RRPTKENFFRRYLELDIGYRKRLGELLQDPVWEDTDEQAVRERMLSLSEEQIAQLLRPRDLGSYRFGYRERVTDLDKPHIRDLPAVLPELFAKAALRCAEAGFDGVELHFAHAYTMAGFLSALNTRDDGYGGPRENRVRLPLEVY